MGIIDEIKSEKLGPTRTCRVSVVASELGDDGADFIEACDDATISMTAIVRWAQKKNIKISDASIIRHRKKVCTCVR